MKNSQHSPLDRRAASTARPELDMEKKLARVESFMHRLARGNRIDRTGAMAMEQLNSGGKRFRARLSLLVCEALEVPTEDAICWAGAVELLHNATLVHDDIQDQDTTRRGQPTLWVNHGVAQAINAGDFLLMLPFLALAEFPSAARGDLSLAVASAATRTVRGQVEEIGMRGAGRLDWDCYLSAASGKTGALLALPAEGSALLAGRGVAQAQNIADIFAKIGVLFQIQDDVLDLFGDKGREASGSDILEGKISALVVELLKRRPDTRDEVLEILDRPRALTTRSDVAHMETLYRESGALDAVLDRLSQIQSEVRRAPALHSEPKLAAVAELLMKLALAPVAHLMCSEVARSVKTSGAEA